MALKSLVDKFKKKLGWEGKNLRSLIVNIFARGRKGIEQQILQDTFADWKKQEKKLGKLELPKITDFFSSDAKLVSVAQIDSKEITETLKQQLLQDLKTAIDKNQKTGLFKKGNLLNDAVLDDFKSNLRQTFDNYTRKDPVTPSKLETIALTESRGIVNNAKERYVQSVLNNNPNLDIWVTWQHYPWKSKEPRKGHNEVNRQKIRLGQKFQVNYYKQVKGKLVKAGVDYMKHPHDPIGGARQNINCHCDQRYEVKRKGD